MNNRLQVLKGPFLSPAVFRVPGPDQLLPFRFHRLSTGKVVLTNFVGEHMVVEPGVVEAVAHGTLPRDSKLRDELVSHHILMEGGSRVALELLAARFRTRLSRLPNLTELFIFVTTLRCEHTCRYCQVSRVTQDRERYDMTEEAARDGVALAMTSPAPAIKIEFQGGEPLLNFELLKSTVEFAETVNANRKILSFVVATNLALLKDEHLQFFKEHGVSISTSLDGPEALHNKNRPRPGGNSYQLVIDGIARARAALGHDSVAALMTTTEDSLRMAVEIVDEYVKQGFSSIFLRSRSPYGFAARRGSYSAGEWHQFYRRALGHIVNLNMKGTPIREEFTAMLLQRMLTDQPTGYVDLQSPAGLGLGALVINYDGMVYASDESRMLAEMGDHSFLLGPVAGSSVDDLVGGDKLAGLLFDTMTEGVPMCVDCAFQPWCGADPVLHHATQGDAVGYKPSSEHCSKYMSAFEEILGLLHSDTATSQVLRSWVRP